ncbi:MAG: hypothetical protein ACN6RE_08410 [Stenotrophomonas sepilia]
MSAQVEFRAKCFGANLGLTRDSDNSWRMSLYTFVGKDRKHQGIAFACASPGQVPRVHTSDAFTPASLWIGSASFDLPENLVSKLQAFIAEHTKGGAA